MIGNPGETREQALETIEFARNLNADYIHLSVATPFPATELYRLGFNTGLYREDYWRDFSRNPSTDFKPRLWTEVMSHEELVNLMQYGYRRYYMRAGYIMKRVMDVRSWGEFKRKAKAGIRILTGERRRRRYEYD